MITPPIHHVWRADLYLDTGIKTLALFEIVDHDQIQSIHAFQITKNEQCQER